LIAQPRGQRTDAGADLQHDIGATEFGRAGDEVDEVQVDEEILAKAVLRFQPRRRQAVSEVTVGLSLAHTRRASSWRSMYLARMSVSRLIVSPGWHVPRV